MKPKSDLYDLIHSLTKAEKRQFKLYSKRYSKIEGSNLLKLFDLIEKQSYFNEEEIKLAFADTTFIKQLHVTKNHLYNLILECLENTNISKEQKTRSYLNRIDFLRQKELKEQANIVIEKAIKYAKENEQYEYLLLLMTKRLRYREPEKSSKDIIENETIQMQNYAEILTHCVSLFVKNIKLMSNGKRVFRTPKEKKAYYSLFANEKEVESIIEKSKRLELLFLQNRDQFFFTENDKDKASKNGDKIRQLWQKYDYLIDQDLKAYYTAIILASQLNIHLKNDSLSKVVKVLEEIKLLPLTTKQQESIRIGTDLQQINYYNARGNFKKSIEVVEETVRLSKTNFAKGNYNIAMEIRWNFTVACTYLYEKNYNKAEEYLSYLVYSDDTIPFNDYKIVARILQLINYYHADKIELLYYKIIAIDRFYKKYERISEVEKLLLSFFKRNISSAMSNIIPKKEFIGLKTVLEKLFKDDENKSIFYLFNFLDWVNSNIEGVSMIDYQLRKAKA
ncbi:MAG: hypothetical protein J0M08_09435 [Bacteroidetes bacterium]|nr:hypothetical protein [Bacteroidota bacterium]